MFSISISAIWCSYGIFPTLSKSFSSTCDGFIVAFGLVSITHELLLLPIVSYFLSPSKNSLRQSIGLNERSILPLSKVPPGTPQYIPCMSLEVAGKEWILEAGRSSGFKLLNCASNLTFFKSQFLLLQKGDNTKRQNLCESWITHPPKLPCFKALASLQWACAIRRPRVNEVRSQGTLISSRSMIQAQVYLI